MICLYCSNLGKPEKVVFSLESTQEQTKWKTKYEQEEKKADEKRKMSLSESATNIVNLMESVKLFSNRVTKKVTKAKR